MKKLLFVAAFAVFGLTVVNAQKNVVKVNPLGLIFGSAELSYERAISEKGAFEISASYMSIDATFNNSTEETGISGVGAEAKYKFYFSSVNDAPRGWYAAPLANFYSITGKEGSSKGKVNTVGGGAVAGYQWVFGGGNTGFALDLNLGAQYLSVSTSGDINGTSIDGIIPRLGISLGYAF